MRQRTLDRAQVRWSAGRGRMTLRITSSSTAQEIAAKIDEFLHRQRLLYAELHLLESVLTGYMAMAETRGIFGPCSLVLGIRLIEEAPNHSTVELRVDCSNPSVTSWIILRFFDTLSGDTNEIQMSKRNRRLLEALADMQEGSPELSVNPSPETANFVIAALTAEEAGLISVGADHIFLNCTSKSWMGSDANSYPISAIDAFSIYVQLDSEVPMPHLTLHLCSGRQLDLELMAHPGDHETLSRLSKAITR